MKKLSLEEFIEKANKKHNNEYDYSVSIYTTARSKIKISCPYHGVFEQTASCHLTGDGCKICFGGINRGRGKNKIGLIFGSLLVLDFATHTEIIEAGLNVSGGKTYFKCQCKCGQICILSSTKLGKDNGFINECFCGKPECNPKRVIDPLLTSARSMFSWSYGSQHPGDITFEKDFYILSQQNCFYCGAAPSNKYNYAKSKPNSPAFETGWFIYNGLDRIDSKKPHDLDNVVPCCKLCNYAKHTMTLDEFRNWAIRLSNIFLNKKNKIISHRGNLNGSDLKTENNPIQIKKVLSIGYDVEIDLFSINNKLFLGHDNPQYEINRDFILSSGLWIHCKNFEALKFCSLFKEYLNFFYHEEDTFVLTSRRFIWTFPQEKIPLDDISIAVLPERVPNWDVKNAGGVCTDFPIELEKNINFKIK